MTTSWRAPTAKQIAEETRERNAREGEREVEGEGQELTAWDPPPTYNSAYDTSGAPPPFAKQVW